MRRIAFAPAALVGLIACAGCGSDFYADSILKPSAQGGRLMQDMTGSARQLLEHKRIDLHRRPEMPDGTVIDVWVLRRHAEGEPRGTMVLLHGLGGTKADYLDPATRLAKMGYDAVLMDLRAHGRSDGTYITYGAKEKHDVKAVLDGLLSSGDVHAPLYAYGATLGGTTAIQYAAIEPRCKGVMAVAPYKDAASMARRQIALVAPTMSQEDFQAVLARAATKAGFDPADASAVAAAKDVGGPLLLVHGLLDLSVPLNHSKAIYAAAQEPKKLVVVTPGPEQVALAVVWEHWLADQMDKLARNQLNAVTTEPPGR